MGFEVELAGFLRVLKLRVAATTYIRKEYQIRQFVAYIQQQGISFAAVTRPVIEAFLATHTAAPATKQQWCCSIRELYAFLKLPNPTAGMAFRNTHLYTLPSVPSKERIERALAALDSAADRHALRNRLLMELAYGSGLRRAELRNLDHSDIDDAEQTVYVLGKRSKTRIVPLTQAALDLIREYRHECRTYQGPLFISRFGTRLSLCSINLILRTKAGIRTHQLRHACATHMLINGCDIRSIQELLGHADIRSTQVYTHLDTRNLKEVLKKNHPRSL